jgi:hypothetical protein
VNHILSKKITLSSTHNMMLTLKHALTRKLSSSLILTSTLTMAFSLTLSGCSNNVIDYPATAIDVVPVIYQYALSERVNKTAPHAKSRNNKKTASALERELSKELHDYLLANKMLLINNTVKFSYQNQLGLSLAQQAQDWLLKQGAGQEKITLLEQSTEQASNQKTPALLLVEIKSYQVQAPRCIGTKINQLAITGNNCAVAGARWLSMVNPEKMLPPRATAQQPAVEQAVIVNDN